MLIFPPHHPHIFTTTVTPDIAALVEAAACVE